MTDRFYMDIKKITVAHECELDRANRCEYPNGRGSFGLVYVLDGTAEYRFTSGEKVTVTNGNMIYLSPCVAYSINSERAFRHYTVNFEIHPDSSVFGLLDGVHYCVHNGDSDQLERCIQKVVSLRNSKKDEYEMEAVGWLYTLLAQFYRQYTDTRDNKRSRLSPAKEYIEGNFDKNVSLEELARLCSMSATNFRREWKKLYSDSPLAYRDSIRLHHAGELLSSGYYTVGEVAERCGFDDVSYFIRFFKKHIGITPSRYKQQSV